MKHSLELKNDLWDAYYALGMYHFWTGYYSKFFSWLPFVGNAKGQGIEEVKTAIEKGVYVNVEASSSLLRIFFTEQEYDKAITLAQEILRKYPDYLYCYWYLAESYTQLKEYDQAIGSLEWIQNYFDHSDLAGPTGLLEVKYKLGLCYYEKKDYDKALSFLTEVAGSNMRINNEYVNLNEYPRLADKLIKKIEEEK